MRHRHLDVPEGVAPADLPLAALDDLIARGDLDDWAPVLRAIAADPSGPLAGRVSHLVRANPQYGTSAALLAFVERRANAQVAAQPFAAGPALRRVREARGVTQAVLAERLGMTQAEVSKLERRRDVLLSTARAYVAGLDGELVLGALIGNERLEIG